MTSRSVVRILNACDDLSSTPPGSGVTVTYGMVTGIQTPIACLIKLAEAIDFSTPGGHKVSILIFLLFPDIPTHENSQSVSSLLQRLLDVGGRQTLISEQCPEKICQLLNHSIDFRENQQNEESHSGINQSIDSRNQDIQNYLDEWAMLEVTRKKYEERV
jgi:PTS system nitrogen regulatory IIA component